MSESLESSTEHLEKQHLDTNKNGNGEAQEK